MKKNGTWQNGGRVGLKRGRALSQTQKLSLVLHVFLRFWRLCEKVRSRLPYHKIISRLDVSALRCVDISMSRGP